jgi:hypothetical protein
VALKAFVAFNLLFDFVKVTASGATSCSKGWAVGSTIGELFKRESSTHNRR